MFIKFQKSTEPLDTHLLSSITSFLGTSNFQILKSCKYYGFNYKIGMYLFREQQSNIVVFDKIVHMISLDESTIVLRCVNQNFVFDEKYHAFCSKYTLKRTINFTHVSDNWIEPLEAYKIDGQEYICPPYRLFE